MEQMSGASGSQTANVEALNKRSMQLLKVALKPHIWGNVCTIKLPWFIPLLSLSHSPRVEGWRRR
jgi:hypothetical protein